MMQSPALGQAALLLTLIGLVALAPIYALDLKAGASREQVIDAVQGHIRAWGQLAGAYQR